ncbi:MAG: GNAT family N-acetyltransferase [Erysipelotrichales bacterium]|nr:MAG: GNAT family N-acetyltransferase [Erysipelotrichales bacterium]
MKLCKASATDKEVLYKQWKEAFEHDDGGSIDHYFSAYYNPKECYLLKEEDTILSSLQIHRHTMVLQGKRLEIAYIVGVLTPPAFRKKGYMKRLMEEVLDILDHQCLITVLQAYIPEIYEPFGFQKIYRRKRFTVDKSMVPTLSTQGISYTMDSHDLLSLYKQFTSHFDGYFLREEGYFEKRIAELKAEGGKVMILKEQGVVKGYCIFTIEAKHIDIDEILYVDAVSLLKMVSTLLNGKDKVMLHVSANEDLSRILPDSPVNLEEYMSVRINDFDLFNKLFETRVTTSSQAMTLGGKPLWVHDSQ